VPRSGHAAAALGEAPAVVAGWLETSVPADAQDARTSAIRTASARTSRRHATVVPKRYSSTSDTGP